ncbi:MAG TPA: polyphenol oxidase family protein [Longimicrobiales bacterium]|nr:polyphenol oxidase family protein [Longimicrobiales bacterium]
MNDASHTSDGAVRRVTETPGGDGFPGLVHPSWSQRWPWLVQGVTVPGEGRDRDFGLFGSGPAGVVVEWWEGLLLATGMTAVVHARQPHGATVRVHTLAGPGLHLSAPADAHAGRDAGLLMAVTVADCVPAFLVAQRARAVAMVHAGWRGAAAGILERAVALLGERFGVHPGETALHLGPSICGDCYEVGPEVHEALGEPVPDGPMPVDLPANLARRARSLGIPEEETTRSSLCTLCGPVDFFSHRRGDAGRQVGFLGVR